MSKYFTMKKKALFPVILVLAIFFFVTVNTFANTTGNEDRPNILLIIADDATYNDLPIYGGTNIKTPNIDKLAGQGLTFDNAYISTSMCKPARASLYTGLYPAKNGVAWNHSPARSQTKSIVHHLRDLNYRVGIAGKIHTTPRKVFPFEKIKGVERGSVSKTAKYDPAGMEKFMTRKKDQPFFLAVGFNSPHAPWTVGEPEQFNPEEFDLPPNLADTEETRKDFARYLAEIKVLDRQVGKTLEALEKTGKAENTIVIFTSEQGSQFPGNKWTNWNTGVHTGLVVRWPGVVEQGGRTQALAQYVDIVPTLLEAVGGSVETDRFDGKSFLPVLKGETDKHRDYAYFMHNNVPEGPSYPIRGVTDGTYHYIHNLKPDNMYIEKHLMAKANTKHNYWLSWIINSTTDSQTYELTQRYLQRPEEQLYNTQKDPYNMRNLAKDPRMVPVKERLSTALNDWMLRQGDPGAPIDSWKQLRKARKDNHFELH